MLISRRQMLAGGSGFVLAASVLPQSVPYAHAETGAPPSRYDEIKTLAHDLAAKPFDDKPDDLPKELKDLSYARYRRIAFHADQAAWRDGGLFRIEFFHRGFQFDRRVKINLLSGSESAVQPYSPDQFDFGDLQLKDAPVGDLGFSGFRVHFPLNRGDYFDEFAVFQGASYFRLIGRGQQYGLSERGLAIDTAEAKGEEFPFFREFWLERPAHDAHSMTVYGLLDSRSLTGAFRFVLTPGTATAAAVSAVLYPRTDIHKLGIAPLTSMYLHGKLNSRSFADIRPEVHDSDGLMLHLVSGERLWRPLVNPRGLRVSSFHDDNVRGFGLMQRDLRFDSYQDVTAKYEARPSLWVVPDGDWGPGSIELVEIPSDEDLNDNIVAYWVPQKPAKANEPIEIGYRLNAYLKTDTLSPIGRTVATRVGPAEPVNAEAEDRHRPHLFWVDFGGGDTLSLQSDQPVEAKIDASTGTLRDVTARKLDNGTWRAAFVLSPDGNKDAELRGFLALRGVPLTETWTFRWSAE